MIRRSSLNRTGFIRGYDDRNLGRHVIMIQVLCCRQADTSGKKDREKKAYIGGWEVGIHGV